MDSADGHLFLTTCQNTTKAQLPIKLDYFDSEVEDQLSVRFRGCSFAHNGFSGIPPAVPFIITGTSSQNHITIADSTFNDNTMVISGGGVSG